MRQNGFQAPFDLIQVTGWICFPIIVAGFYAFVVPFLPNSTDLVLAAVYGVIALMCIILTIVTTSIDPADRNVLNNADLVPAQVTNDHLYCNVCTQYVDKKSRHCRICEKCVATFDHHCKWLNNCIGEHNYRYFFALIVSISSLVTLHLALVVYLFVRCFTNDISILTQSALSFGCSDNQLIDGNGLCPSGYKFSLLGIKIVLGAYLTILASSFPPIVQLVYFHIKLYFLQTTTYDYIIQQRRAQLAHEEGDGECRCACRVAPSGSQDTPARNQPKATPTPMLSGFGRPSAVHVQDNSSHETKSPVSPSQREEMSYEPIETPAPTKNNAFFV